MERKRSEKQKYYSVEHSCKFCGKSFPFKSRLVIHERIRTGEKAHECDIYKKSFVQNSDLLKHKRKHTGEKPYECVILKRHSHKVAA